MFIDALNISIIVVVVVIGWYSYYPAEKTKLGQYECPVWFMQVWYLSTSWTNIVMLFISTIVVKKNTVAIMVPSLLECTENNLD